MSECFSSASSWSVTLATSAFWSLIGSAETVVGSTAGSTVTANATATPRPTLMRRRFMTKRECSHILRIGCEREDEAVTNARAGDGRPSRRPPALTPGGSLPLDRAGRLRRDVVDHPVDTVDLVDHPVRDAL